MKCPTMRARSNLRRNLPSPKRLPYAATPSKPRSRQCRDERSAAIHYGPFRSPHYQARANGQSSHPSRRPPPPAVALAPVVKPAAVAKAERPRTSEAHFGRHHRKRPREVRNFSGSIDQGSPSAEDGRRLPGLEAAIGSRPRSYSGKGSRGRHPRTAAARRRQSAATSVRRARLPPRRPATSSRRERSSH